MPVRVSYNEMKEAPVTEVVDIYSNIIVHNLENKSKKEYQEIIKPLSH